MLTGMLALFLAFWLVKREHRALIYECTTVLRESEPFAEVRSSLKMDKTRSVRLLNLNIKNLHSSPRRLLLF